MYKKGIAFLLTVVMTLGASMPTFAATEDLQLDPDMVLLSSKVIIVDDDEGNQVEVTIEEYGNEVNQSNGLSRGIIQEYPVGTKRNIVLTVSNNQLGLGSLVVGAPLTAAMKAAVTTAVKNALPAAVSPYAIPAVVITTWVAAAIAFANSSLGNTGFKANVGIEYTATYINGQGHYLYDWSPKTCVVTTY